MNEPWTPNQLRVIRELLEWDEGLAPLRGPTDVREGLRTDLVAELEELTLRAAATVAQDDQRLSINKFDITNVHKCEGLFVAPDDFEWTLAKVRGRVVHRAIQKSCAGRFKEMAPLELVQETVESMVESSDDPGVGEYLKELDPSAMGQLLSEAGAMLAAFSSDWPPIRPAMHPRIEPPVHVRLHEGRITLRGRYDLALGPAGRGPVVITDLKSGTDHPEHREEARYYALLETIRNGVPPVRVASYYLDGGWFQPEDVNEDVLRSAVRRTGDAINLIVQLWWRQREPVLSPGWHCRYCPSQLDCLPGSRWLVESQNRVGLM